MFQLTCEEKMKRENEQFHKINFKFSGIENDRL